jgi:CHAT domain-containing protein
MKKILLLLTIIACHTAYGQRELQEIDNLIIDGQFDKALIVIEQQKNVAPAFPLLNKKAEVLIRQGKYDEAEQLLASLATEQRSNVELAALKTNRGLLYLNIGRNDLASDNLEDALRRWDAEGKSQTLEAAQTQSHIGNLFRSTGKYVQAEEQLTMSLMTRQKLLNEKHELIAASLNDLGLLYSQTDMDKALSYYEKALSLYEGLHGKDHPKIAIANTNMAYIYSRMELFGDAVNNFENALAIWNKMYPGAHPSKAFVLFSLGTTNERMKNLPAAKQYYEKALAIYRETYKTKHPEIARVLNALGNIEKADNKFPAALAYYEKAMEANHPHFAAKAIGDNPTVGAFYDGNVLLYSLLYKAQTLEASHFGRTLRFKELLEAIRTLQSCDTLIDRLRQQTRNEGDKIALGTIAAEVYADGVRICAEAAHAALNKSTYLKQAFYFAEKSKAAVLTGAISDANAKSFAGIPASLLDQEKQLKAAIAMVSQKLAQMPEAKEEQYLRETYYELNRGYELFSHHLEQEYPAYYNLKYNNAAPSVDEIAKRLQPGSLLLSYFIDDKNSRLYLFKLTSKGLTLEQRSLPVQFDRYLVGLRNSLFYSDLATYREASAILSALLLPKLSGATTDLIIIPTAKLGTIPFEALLTRKATATDTYQTMPYLARKASVRYEFSCGLILQKQVRKKVENSSILLCAPVTFASASVSDLPGTEEEVQTISSLFDHRKLPTRVLLRDKADELTIKNAELKRYSLVHFATHGLVDEKNPELSRIFLNSGHGSEDGNLYAGEIYNLELNADLVTLSACQTGLGKIAKGEGVIGLSRALVFAGARNCMVSFWSVADESTAALMKDYYTILLNSPTHNYSATLQQAKLNLINSGQYSSPFYWAPFILIGF